MSTPIKNCRFMKAITDQGAFDALVRDMAYNLKQKHFSIYPCDCTPPCRVLTKEEDAQIKNRIHAAVQEEYKKPNSPYLF